MITKRCIATGWIPVWEHISARECLCWDAWYYAHSHPDVGRWDDTYPSMCAKGKWLIDRYYRSIDTTGVNVRRKK